MKFGVSRGGGGGGGARISIKIPLLRGRSTPVNTARHPGGAACQPRATVGPRTRTGRNTSLWDHARTRHTAQRNVSRYLQFRGWEHTHGPCSSLQNVESHIIIMYNYPLKCVEW